MLPVFLLALGLAAANGADPSQLCNSIAIHATAVDVSSGALIFALNLTVDFAVLTGKADFNTITFSDFHFTASTSNVQQLAPLQCWDGNEGVMVKCPDTNGTCVLTVPDGVGFLEVPVAVNGVRDFPTVMDDLVIDSGTVFVNDGTFFSYPNEVCLLLESSSQSIPNMLISSRMCCNNYIPINIPDVTETCSELSSSTFFNLANNDTVGSFAATYALTQNFLNMTVSGYSGPPTGSYFFSPNENDNFEVYGTQLGKQLSIPLGKGDFQFDLELEIWDPYPQTFHYSATVGEVVRRQGVVMWGQNHAFTRTQPCSLRAAPGNNGTTAYSQLCCTAFRPMHTEGKCAEYRSKTFVRQNNKTDSFADVRYRLSGSVLHLNILNFSVPNSQNERAQVEAFSKKTLDQICSTNTLSSNQQCNFTLFDADPTQFTLRSTKFPDGFPMFNLTQINGTVTQPPLTPCHSETHNLNGHQVGTASAFTELCCIATANGPWPGSN